MTVAVTRDERLALIKQIAERRQKMAKVRARSTTVKNEGKKVKRDFIAIPEEKENVYAWTDAPKYAQQYYGETMYYTTKFDNDWD
jgi:hypothetical protein